MKIGLENKDISVISRVIKNALEENLIKAVDPTTELRYLKYIPFGG
ncbi:hypothetical protein J2Z35_002586 [Acetoanaerobium pronyense]|uniref:Uncharacterized protein n=1 Tax=Acetoanaerobium pronyense TaxID=1482736 RepID=A0ABS4KNP4_9FIRM|nr:hypothetical protein [Acetoanaerobium pronyense]MBP2028756.1 hypothetical protein [Acetoanaerobium pronyense]